MNITEVRVKMVHDTLERLRAFCSITLDGAFVIRDLKIIDGGHGPFVAMPSRKLTDRCARCGFKNHLRARFCNECGVKLNENRVPRDDDGRVKLHADIAHPINADCRERIQQAVIEAFQRELELQKDPDYAPTPYDDHDDATADGDLSDFDELINELRSERRQRDDRAAAGGRRDGARDNAAGPSAERGAAPATGESREPFRRREQAPRDRHRDAPTQRERAGALPAGRNGRSHARPDDRRAASDAKPQARPQELRAASHPRPVEPRATAPLPPVAPAPKPVDAQMPAAAPLPPKPARPAPPPAAVGGDDADSFAAGIF